MSKRPMTCSPISSSSTPTARRRSRRVCAPSPGRSPQLPEAIMTTRTPVPRLRAYDGPALLSYGFRPFFLFGSAYAGVAVLVWLPAFYGELSLHSAFAPRDWHVHEMLYGYLPAVITGFLFTAIPNWTGQLPIQGRPLAALLAVWIAGRLAVTFSADLGWA